MRKTLIALCGISLVVVGSLSAQQAGTPEEDNHWRDFKRKLIWKGPLVKTLVSASFNEIRDSPHEWGRGWEGFAKRAGNSFGQRAIKATVELGVSEWTHEDLHYHRLGEGGFFRRLRHAAVSTFWVRRDNGTGNTFAVGRVSGAFAAGQISRTWMPARVADFGAGMQTFGSAMGLDVGFNVFREFWPRKH
jgi:hypothetical protein